MLSLATGRALTGEHVFQRCRVLIVSLEDGPDQLRRRLKAAYLHHKIELKEVKGWLFLAALGRAAGKLMVLDKHGRPAVSALAAKLESTIKARNLDVVLLDPFVKTHAVSENDNSHIDEVAQVLTDLCGKLNVALDVPHHMAKGIADPGNANKGRGASSLNAALRLVRTATRMTVDEAISFGVAEGERRRLFRVDDAKLNIAPMMEAKWVKLVGVDIGNETELYPNGDNVQAAESWLPPDLFFGVSSVMDDILNEIDADEAE
jgi:RecA-family ATPase